MKIRMIFAGVFVMPFLFDFYANLRGRILYPHAYKIGKEVLYQATLSADQIQIINQQRRCKLLQYVYNNIPLYHKKYSLAGIEYGDLTKTENWDHLPIITKDDVRNLADQMIVANDSLNNLASSATGGSTGEPVKFYSDPHRINTYLGRHFLGAVDIKKNSNQALVGRFVPDPTTLHAKLRRILSTFRPVDTVLDAKSVNAEKIKKFLSDIRKYHQYYIYGYAGGIYQLACFMEKYSLSINSPQAIITTSAPLAEFQRQKIEQIFGCKVYSQYGCCEIPWLAMECRQQDGLHVLDPARKIDIVNADGKPCAPGTVGNILISNLLDYRFPLIRYKVGDRASVLSGKCACGSNLSRITPVRGRETDCINLHDGGFIAGDYLTTIFDDYPHAVEAFQIEQISLKLIKLRVVPNVNYAAAYAEIEQVHKQLQNRCGATIVQIENVPEIISDRGKIRYIINRLTIS